MSFLSLFTCCRSARGMFWHVPQHKIFTDSRTLLAGASCLQLSGDPQIKLVEMLTSPLTAPRLLPGVQPSTTPPSQGPPELEATRLICFHLSYLFNRKFAV